MFNGFDTNIAHERNKAVAFLFTIGAKALVMEEHAKQNVDSAMEEEAVIKHEIDREERIRDIRRESLDRLQVYKISRSGKIRMLYIKFYFNHHRSGIISWKSMWKFKKLFVLDKTLQITFVDSEKIYAGAERKPASSSPKTGIGTGLQAAAMQDDSSAEIRQPRADESNLKSVTFLKFENRSRYLIIGFGDLEEMHALLEIISERLPSAQVPQQLVYHSKG